jgi:hypothetical protein
MTALLIGLVIIQGGLLLWASIHLSNVVLRTDKLGPASWTGITGGGAVAIPYLARSIDLNRFLCSAGDCLFLVLAVACVRVIAVMNENERLQRERDVAARRAEEVAKAARKAREAQQLAATAAALEAQTAAKSRMAAASQLPRGAPRPPAHPGRQGA